MCRHPMAAMPYYIDNASLNVYSLEEICYYIEHNAYLIEPDFMSEDLCLWVERELKDKKMADSLRETMQKKGELVGFAEVILRGCGYCSEETVQRILSVLREMENKSPFECGKIRADRYMQNGKYAKAVLEYRNLLRMEDACRNDKTTAGNIRHNIGTAYARMFLFNEAALWFQRAFEWNKNRESLTQCMLAYRFAENTEALKKCREIYGITDEEWHLMEECRRKFLQDMPSGTSCEKPREENEPLAELLTKWAKEYKKSCRI